MPHCLWVALDRAIRRWMRVGASFSISTTPTRYVVYFLQTEDKALNSVTERPLCFLRIQRSLLYRSLPPLLLLAYAFPVITPNRQNAWIISSARQSIPSRVYIVRYTRQCMGYGISKGEQDGQLLAMGHCWGLLPRDGCEAIPQRGAVGEGQ